MKYFIDQSGKIEDTAKPTIIAFSNNKNGSIILKTREKRHLLEIYRRAERPRLFTLQVFSCLLFLLIKTYKLNKGIIYIDKEYPGHEDLIKNHLVQLNIKLKCVDLLDDRIEFAFIGKANRAHLLAYKCLKRKRAEFSAKSEDILSLAMLFEH